MEYTMTDYERIHNLIYKYKEDKSVSNEILESFDEFINSYIRLMKEKEYRFKNQSLRSFIFLFIDKSQKNYYKNYMLQYRTKLAMLEAIELIYNSFSRLEEEELRSTMAIALLKMAKSYKDTKPSFHTYVQRCFHLFLIQELKSFLNDDIAKGYYYNLEELADDYSMNDKELESKFEKINNNLDYHYKLKNRFALKECEDVYNNNSLDINWTNGLTCSDIFKCLTPLERDILIRLYINKDTCENIANDYGLCRITINRKKLKAIEKIKEKVK